MQINFRLAAAGYAIKQADLEPIVLPNSLQGSRLIRVQRWTFDLFNVGEPFRGVVLVDNREFFQQRFVDKAFFHPAPSRHGFIQFCEAHALRILNQQQQFRLARSAFPDGVYIGAGASRRHRNFSYNSVERIALTQQRRQCSSDDFANWVMVVVAGELNQPAVSLVQD